jgi:3',5'-cyclic AMP phosphodiesterase CpdA
MALNILHLSDLHFTGKTDPEELAAKIHNVSYEHRLSPDAIVVTGDILDAKKNESAYSVAIDRAIIFFKTILSRFKLNNTTEHLFFVPGNHDIDRKAVEENKLEDQFGRYREFLATIYAEKWSEVRNIYDEKNCCFVKHFADKKTILIGLSSPRYEESLNENSEKENKYIETARITSTQIGKIKRRLESINEYEDNRVIACLHHNIYNTLENKNIRNVDTTCVQDNDLLLSTLGEYNCSLILHGHRHKSKDRRINLSQDVKSNDRLCTVIGGGILAESFNYLEIYDANDDIDLYCMEFKDDTGYYALSEDFYVPIKEKWHLSKVIEDGVKSNPKLSSDYKLLKDVDTDYDPKLIEMFNTVLGSFKELSSYFLSNQKFDKNLVYIAFGVIHYRSNFYANRTFLQESENFIRKATDELELSDLAVKILNIKNVYGLYDIYDENKHKPPYNKHKKELIFLALSIYLSEFFLTIKKRPDEFYKDCIKKKTNYKFEDEDTRTAISGSTIKFEVNEEHRALEITVKCTTANSHKIVSLIIKEFELVLTKFEEDFASIGFKVYYTLPKLMKINLDDINLETHEFAAYIPNLIPLLAGRNIYSEPEAFARELIQNSIDAIKVRAKQEGDEILKDAKIELKMGTDNAKGLHYFKITDHGTGMNRYILERYLATIGRSFYTSEDFENLRLKYSPISQFGIGFLSCFMLGKQVNVYTTHSQNLNETYYLDIPNYDGCFFIETKEEKKESPGSSITVWENTDLRESQEKFDNNKIKEYIKKIICNIPFDVTLNKKIFIPKFDYYDKLKEETKEFQLLFFLPLTSEPDSNGDAAINKEITDHSDHGIYFFKRDRSLYETQVNLVMNNGILVRESSILVDELNKIHPYLDAAFNFPSYALKLDVSRDKLKELKGFRALKYNEFLQAKIRDYLKGDLAKALKYAFWCLLDNKTFKLSDINISYTADKIHAKLEKHPLSGEMENYRMMIEKIERFIIKNRNDLISHRSLMNYANSHFSHFFDLDNILGFFKRRIYQIKKSTLGDEEIMDIQDQFIFYIVYGRRGRNLFQNDEYFNSKFLQKPEKLMPAFIILLYEFITRASDRKLINLQLEDLAHSEIILIMAALKSLLSALYTHSDLSEGIEIPFDDKTIADFLSGADKTVQKHDLAGEPFLF